MKTQNKPFQEMRMLTKKRDEETRIGDMKRVVASFVGERDWEQFRTPENLALSLSLEAAELLELFQWKLGRQGNRQNTGDNRQNTERETSGVSPPGGNGYTEEEITSMKMELADILIYLISFFNRMDWDLTSCFHEKMEMNSEKYPVSLYKGRFETEKERRQ